MTDQPQGEGDVLRPVKMLGGVVLEYRYYMLAILTLIYVVNWIDRYIIAILVEPIKADLGVNNTIMGLLTGTAFGLFYATMGIPLALMADRTLRRNLIAWCLGLFSVMTALCGVAQSAWQFAILRVGVGVGEAGTSPSSHSMIADLFAPKERATALAIMAAGLNIGIFIAFFGGGWIAELYGWRWAFVLAGLPGIFLVIVVRFFLREPPRGHADGYVSRGDVPPVQKVFAHLWNQRTFRHLAIAAALNSFVGYGALQWVPFYLGTAHGMSSGDIGTALAFIIGIFGGIGTFAGGILVDRMSKGDSRWNLWIPAIGVIVGTPFAVAFYLFGNTAVGLALWALPVAASAIYLGPALSIGQGLASLKMRAMASAVLLFIINIIGLGLGPLFVGMLSDFFSVSWFSCNPNVTIGTEGGCSPFQAGEAIRWALVWGSLVNLWAVFHFMMAARTVREELAQVAVAEGGSAS